MAQKSLSESVGLALSDKVYGLAASISQSAEEVLSAIDSVIAAYEKERHPAITINMPPVADTEQVKDTARKIIDSMDVRSASPSKTGGSHSKPTPLTREQLLREVYRYMSANTHVYGGWQDSIEDNNAGLDEDLNWVPGFLVDRFAEHIKNEFNTDGVNPLRSILM